MGTILAAFITNGSLDPCPYFEGYCGEHQYEYPGFEQKSGPRKVPFGTYFCMSLPILLILNSAPVIGRHGTFYPLDYGAVRARKRAALDAASAELAASISARPRPPPSSTAHTRVIRRRNFTLTDNAIAGPSGRSVTDVDPIRADVVASCQEARLLTTLAGGDGISSYDMQGFIEKCSICHMYYLGSILPVHILSCD
jgi:hypothetical protein